MNAPTQSNGTSATSTGAPQEVGELVACYERSIGSWRENAEGQASSYLRGQSSSLGLSGGGRSGNGDWPADDLLDLALMYAAFDDQRRSQELIDDAIRHQQIHLERMRAYPDSLVLEGKGARAGAASAAAQWGLEWMQSLAADADERARQGRRRVIHLMPKSYSERYRRQVDDLSLRVLDAQEDTERMRQFFSAVCDYSPYLEHHELARFDDEHWQAMILLARARDSHFFPTISSRTLDWVRRAPAVRARVIAEHAGGDEWEKGALTSYRLSDQLSYYEPVSVDAWLARARLAWRHFDLLLDRPSAGVVPVVRIPLRDELIGELWKRLPHDLAREIVIEINTDVHSRAERRPATATIVAAWQFSAGDRSIRFEAAYTLKKSRAARERLIAATLKRAGLQGASVPRIEEVTHTTRLGVRSARITVPAPAADPEQVLGVDRCAHRNATWVSEEPIGLRLHCYGCARERVALIPYHRLPDDNPHVHLSRYPLERGLAILRGEDMARFPETINQLRARDGEMTMRPSFYATVSRTAPRLGVEQIGSRRR